MTVQNGLFEGRFKPLFLQRLFLFADRRSGNDADSGRQAAPAWRYFCMVSGSVRVVRSGDHIRRRHSCRDCFTGVEGSGNRRDVEFMALPMNERCLSDFLDGMKFRQGHPKPVGRGQGMAVRHPAVRPRSCSGGVSRDCFGNRCEGGTGYAGRSGAASPPLMPFSLFYSAAEPV